MKRYQQGDSDRRIFLCIQYITDMVANPWYGFDSNTQIYNLKCICKSHT